MPKWSDFLFIYARMIKRESLTHGPLLPQTKAYAAGVSRLIILVCGKDSNSNIGATKWLVCAIAHLWVIIFSVTARAASSFTQRQSEKAYCVTPQIRERPVMSTSTEAQNPLANQLLAALPKEVYEELLPHLEPMSFSLGEVVYESGGQMTHVYFPTSSIISLLYLMANGATAEIGVVGYEGVVGVALFLGGGTTPNRAVVQSAGNAYRMKAHVLREAFEQGGAMQLLLLRYTQALITQISQTAVCNRLHSIEQQLCRWLLLSHDRLRSDQLVMTQDLISNMLGVRREGVTVAARQLKDRGLISYVRGALTIVDRPGLEAAVCECYGVVKTEYDRLLS